MVIDTFTKFNISSNSNNVQRQPIDNIIFYDGVCMLCDRLIRFIIKRDKNKIFRFCHLQSTTAEDLLKPFGLEPKNLNTMYLLHNSAIYEQSSAAIKMAEMLPPSILKVLLIGRIFPKQSNNFIYSLIAKIRYKVFGKKETCEIPDTTHIDRFIL